MSIKPEFKAAMIELTEWMEKHDIQMFTTIDEEISFKSKKYEYVYFRGGDHLQMKYELNGGYGHHDE